MSQAAAIRVASVPCMWELHGHVGRTDPCPSCLSWSLSPAPALLQRELIPSPSPKSWGLLQGTGAAVPALPGKEQAHTSDGKWLPVLNRGSPRQNAAPWAPGSPSALLPAGLGAPRCCCLASEGPPAVPGEPLALACCLRELAQGCNTQRGRVWPIRKSGDEFCNPSPQCKVAEAGTEQTPCSWNLPASSRAGGCSSGASPESARGWPWASRVVTCPGADPGPVACPDLPPAGSCSWAVAAVLLDGAGPSQHQGMEEHTGTELGLYQPCTCRAWAGRNVWILPALLRPLTPSLTFSACQAGWSCVAADVPPSTGVLEQSEGERGHQWEHQWEHPARLLLGTDAGNWQPFPAPSSHVPLRAAQCHQCPGGSWWMAHTVH